MNLSNVEKELLRLKGKKSPKNKENRESTVWEFTWNTSIQY